MKIKLNLIVLILTFSTVSFGANFPIDTETIGNSSVEADDELLYKLPTTLLPTKYDLKIKPDFDKLSIEGDVTITVKVTETTKEIILHKSKDIVFEAENVKVTQTPELGDYVVNDIKYNVINNFCTMTLDKELSVGDATIKIEYTGKIGISNSGFYLANYTDENGETKIFGTTQFESTSAREAFPCFDQPDMKAKFAIRINRPKNYNSISNMRPEDNAEPDPTDDTREIDVFPETPVNMPTYLIAFVVSELTYEKDKDDKYRVYGIPSLIADKRGVYGVEKGEAIIKEMEKFVEVEYKDGLDKLDQVAIPDDYFQAGAMENWGLVTYKQKYLLQKDVVTTASEKQNVLSIIAHEFAHQWFGNLVTPKWWDSLWLSEGFATYFEHYATEQVDSSMKMMDQFITLTNQVALESDASESTRAMNDKVYSPSDISKFFDRIAYQKSGAVIRMMEHIVTTKAFKAGLHNYLETKKADGSVVPEDLWKGIQDAVNNKEILSDDVKQALGLDTREIANIMETWNGQAGYPVVNATRNESGFISLSQDRFLYTKNPSGEDTVWKIPINFATEEKNFTDTKTEFWLEEKEEETEIAVPLEDWFILNKQQTGFYRVNYDEDTWNLIIDYLDSDKFKNIHVLNRAQLIDDSFNLARSGRISYEIPLKLSRYLTRETEYIPLATFLKSVNFLNNYLIATEYYDYFKTFVRESLEKAYEILKIDDTNVHIDKFNRAQVINWLCRFGHENCNQQVHDKLLALEGSALPDLQNPYYCGGMRKSEESDKKFEFLFTLYQNESVEYLERGRIVSGLGCSLNEEYLIKLLNVTIGASKDDFKLNDNDLAAAFTAAYTSSDVGLETTLNFIVDNSKAVKNIFNKRDLESIIKGIASRTSSMEHSKILEKIKDDEDYKTVVSEAVATITDNNKWAGDNLKDVHSWLGSTYGSAGFVTVSVTLLFGMLVVLNVF